LYIRLQQEDQAYRYYSVVSSAEEIRYLDGFTGHLHVRKPALKRRDQARGRIDTADDKAIVN
jgi:hypothetical protein